MIESMLRHASTGEATPLASNFSNSSLSSAIRNNRLTGKAVRELAHRYRAGGLQRARYDKQRPDKARLLDIRARQRLIAMACEEAPAGRARWSVRLIAPAARCYPNCSRRVFPSSKSPIS